MPIARDPRINPKRGDILIINGMRFRVRRATHEFVSTEWIPATPNLSVVRAVGDNMTASLWPAFAEDAVVERTM